MKQFNSILLLIYGLILGGSAWAESNELKLMSWNVYYDDVSGVRRYPAIFSEIQAAGADLVCLQEVTPFFLQQLRQHPLLQKYQLVNAGPVMKYKNVLLSRIELSKSGQIDLPSKLNRKVLQVDFVFNRQAIRLFNVHLDSLEDDADLRIQQFELLYKRAQGASMLICGDMNFGDADKENRSLAGKISDAGSANKLPTYDVDNNTLARKTKFMFEKSRRLDRILYAGPFHLEHYARKVLPHSDHYPIYASLTVGD